MHFYPHNIADFNNSTRHLTRVERSVYRDAIDLYYDTETALTTDIEKLSRRLLCANEEEKEALKGILDEFFDLHNDGYFNERCDEEISKYRANISAKARAGKASAEARKEKSSARKKQNPTVDQQDGNTCSTGVHNQELITKNQEPLIKPIPSKSKYKFDSDHYQLAVELSNPVKQRFQKMSINLDEWADAIRKLIDIDKYNCEQIYQLWQWRTNHQGNNNFTWADNCRTPMKLRAKKDGLSYFEIMKNQMLGEASGNNQPSYGQSRASHRAEIADATHGASSSDWATMGQRAS